jgi:hypothetical protein
MDLTGKKGRRPQRPHGTKKAERQAAKARADERRARIEKAAEAVLSGQSIRATSKETGVCPEAIRSALAKIGERVRDYRQKLPDDQVSRKTLYARAYQARNPEKHLARKAVEYALEWGKLVRGDCQDCGSKEKIEAHHPDYSKPLDIEWLCKPCHVARHAELRRQRKAA